MHWMWSKTFSEAIEFIILICLSTFILQNLDQINSAFFSSVPVGTICLIICMILIFYKIYILTKVYKRWLSTESSAKKITYPLIGVCINLIALSAAFSVNPPIMNLHNASLIGTVAYTVDHTVFNSTPDLTQDLTYVTHPMEAHTTWNIGADGHQLCILHKTNIRDPTYDEMLDFIKADETDEIKYTPGKFVCADYAEKVQNNAVNCGYRCAWVGIDFTYGEGHACNAFNTTDKGLIFIDCTGDTDSSILNCDKIVKIEDGKQYVPVFLFRSNDWTCRSMGIIKSHKIYWS